MDLLHFELFLTSLYEKKNKKKQAEVWLIHAEQMSLYNFIILRKKAMDTDED